MVKSPYSVTVVGAGLAGCEAAWQAARLGVNVTLIEMKSDKRTPAHHTSDFAELVCSNSLRSNQLENAAGLLKEELRQLDSLIMRFADLSAVPAGGALAVDRKTFSYGITSAIRNNPLITVVEDEAIEIPDARPCVIASGPLTSEPLARSIASKIGEDSLFFFDAAAPIVHAENIDLNIAFRASRYGKGSDDYINCPMDKETYLKFHTALIEAETVPLHEFEESNVFEGCMPIESMAKRGLETLRYGPLKPVGITVPASGREAWAIVQLRQDNSAASLYNLVGFQTRLTWSEQKRVFRMIPGLENAEFERFGVMHRNTYINSPKFLDSTYALKNGEGLYFAGQITGVEGYIESVSSGWLAGVNAALCAKGQKPLGFTSMTVIGALAAYVSNPAIHKFQPMNANFGILKPMPGKWKDKKKKNLAISDRALSSDEIKFAQTILHTIE